MNKISNRVLEIIREGAQPAKTSKTISNTELIALHVLANFKIKPGNKDLKTLVKLNLINNNKLTPEGTKILNLPINKNKIKELMS